jgi:hypothetical protein
MSSFVRRSSLLAIALVLSLFGNAVLAPAQAAVPLDKHARKIQNKLAKYPQGAYLHLVVAGAPDAYGRLGTLSETGFTFTAADNNAPASFRYSDVEKVKDDDQRVGRGAEPIHIRHWMPIAITVGALAAGYATYAAVK